MNSQVERCKIKNTKLQELAKSSDKSTASEFRDLKKGSINYDQDTFFLFVKTTVH